MQTKRVKVGNKLVLKAKVEYLKAGEIVEITAISGNDVWLACSTGTTLVKASQLKNSVREVL